MPAIMANDNTKTVICYLDSKIWIIMQFAFNKPQITFVLDETKKIHVVKEQKNFGDIVSADMTKKDNLLR